MELLPAVDLRGGRAVRLVQGDFERETGFGDPLALAERLVEAGARWLHVVDLDAARTGEPANRPQVLAIVERTAGAGVQVQVGGGVRTEGAVEELLVAGAARVVLGTAAVESPDMASACAGRFPGRVAVGLDYRFRPDGSLEAASRGWREGSGRTVTELLDALGSAPLGAVVVTAIERDGTRSGPDVAGLGEVLDLTGLPVVASGGIGTLADLRSLARLRSPASGRALAGAVMGRALLDGDVDVGEAIAACAPSV